MEEERNELNFSLAASCLEGKQEEEVSKLVNALLEQRLGDKAELGTIYLGRGCDLPGEARNIMPVPSKARDNLRLDIKTLFMLPLQQGGNQERLPRALQMTCSPFCHARVVCMIIHWTTAKRLIFYGPESTV